MRSGASDVVSVSAPPAICRGRRLESYRQSPLGRCSALVKCRQLSLMGYEGGRTLKIRDDDRVGRNGKEGARTRLNEHMVVCSRVRVLLCAFLCVWVGLGEGG